MPSRGRRSNAARRQLDAAAERARQRREEEERSREAEERKLDEDNDAVEDYEDLVEDDDDLVEDDDGVEGDDEHGDEGAAAGDGNNTATGNVPIPENLRTRALGQAQATAQLEKSALNRSQQRSITLSLWSVQWRRTCEPPNNRTLSF
jgi:hypothetical protein